MATLYCTLGKSIDIPIEAIALTSFSEKFDLYSYSEDFEKIKILRDKYNIKNTDKLVIFSTDQKEINKISSNLVQALEKKFISSGLLIKKVDIYILKNIEDIRSNEISSSYDNMIFSVILKNKIENPSEPIYLCIAGGRKTMSSSLQNAGFILGADFVFHLIEESNNESDLSNNASDLIDKIKNKIKNIIPVALGSFEGNSSLINYQKDDFNDLKNLIINYFSNAENISLESDSIDANIYKLGFSTKIKEIIDEKYQKATTFYSNWNDRIETTEDIFKILYTYNRKNVIEILKNYYIGKDPIKGKEEFEILKKLPKSDLHCHLGGVLSAEDLVELANESRYMIESEIKKTNLDKYKLEELKSLIKKSNGLKNFSYENLKKSTFILYFISLFENNIEQLDNFIFDEYIDWKKFRDFGIEKYERLGDIQGSSLLQTKSTITFAVKKCIEKSLDHNVKHLEIRSSPINYTKEGLKDIDVLETILRTMDQYSNQISLSLIIISSRHGKMSDIYRNIELVQNIYESKNKEIKDLFIKYFKGFDLAGDEEKGKPEQFRQAFLSIMNYCPNITIHAGETVKSESIWQAVYHLNAERIGHGLSLLEDENLIKKIRERKIAIELCPSSNYQIKNYYDSYYLDDEDIQSNKSEIINTGSNKTEYYPLKDYIDKRLKVTINTDNMGISRTNITNEFLKAARMTENGLSLWDIFKIIKMGFKSAFVDYDSKMKLYKNAEDDISNFINSFIKSKKG
jgi:adenosine deaminase